MDGGIFMGLLIPMHWDYSPVPHQGPGVRAALWGGFMQGSDMCAAAEKLIFNSRAFTNARHAI